MSLISVVWGMVLFLVLNCCALLCGVVGCGCAVSLAIGAVCWCCSVLIAVAVYCCLLLAFTVGVRCFFFSVR